jgi:hypothetical protein
MPATTNSALLVILLGIAATTQNHLAKALERQGIDVFDMLRARLKRSAEEVPSGFKKPLIYTVGLILNHTTFLYHLMVAPLKGNTALYTSMYGMGLVTLLVYSTRVMKERISRLELTGALTICLGTLTLGLEGVSRPPPDMSHIDLARTGISLVILLSVCALLILTGMHNGSPRVIGLLFGLCAGICGCLDPFLKGVGQATGGAGKFLPSGFGGWLLLAFSFIIGEAAVVITQVGFIHRSRANILVPAYNCSYVAIPVLLQAFLLPGYILYWSTGGGLVLIMVGIVLMRAFRAEAAALPS